MSAGGELLPPADAWLGSGCSASPHEAPSSSHGFWRCPRAGLDHRPSNAFPPGPRFAPAAVESPDLRPRFPGCHRGLGGRGQDPALILVDAEQARQQHFAGLTRLVAEVPAAPVICSPERSSGSPPPRLSSFAPAAMCRNHRANWCCGTPSASSPRARSISPAKCSPAGPSAGGSHRRALLPAVPRAPP